MENMNESLFALFNIEEIERTHSMNVQPVTRNNEEMFAAGVLTKNINCNTNNTMFKFNSKQAKRAMLSLVNNMNDETSDIRSNENCDPFESCNDDGLSQLCKSSQFIRQIDGALKECIPPSKAGDDNTLLSDRQSSARSERVSSNKFSASTTSVPATNSTPDNEQNQHSTADMFDRTDGFKMTAAESQPTSPEYKRQVAATFVGLQTSILEPGAPGNTTINAIDWDETMKTCHAAADNFTELGLFYGLPAKMADLLQQFKGIDKLYDWQDECLRLEAVKCRRNLVYSLPTSGGKTLVSEILMMREVLCRKKNALIVLPYVSIVQEKLAALAPFAVALDFLLEEYAAGRGRYPPRRRRHKRSVYVATIEKALGLVNSLIENDRMNELGLVVVDELHLVGEQGRGAVLEILLTKLLCGERRVQIVGMSATIGNLPELCCFLNAELYCRNFRPVKLQEYVCCEGELALRESDGTLRPVKNVQNSDHYNKLDPDGLGILVGEIVPNGSCLLFCSTKKNCENVALLLTRVLDRRLLEHKRVEKKALIQAMEAEGTDGDEVLRRSLPFGVAYHHSGLTSDERRSVEEAFRGGTICVICCTSTLAAGVNLPAERVILRSPYVGLEFISLARYKQMSGRAGRAGLSTAGESILVCVRKDLERVKQLLDSPMESAVSRLPDNDCKGLKSLLMSCIALGTATTRRALHRVARTTLMAAQTERQQLDVKAITDGAIADLFKRGALQTKLGGAADANESVLMQSSVGIENANQQRQVVIGKDTQLSISKLGRAAIRGGLELDKAHILHEDLLQAQAGLVLVDCLHLLYLVTPYELTTQVRPSPHVYYSLYAELGEGQLQTARTLGITEAVVVGMMSGKRRRKDVSERVLHRFYLTLMLHELWTGCSVGRAAARYKVSRGLVQQLMTAAATFASSVVHFCSELEELWPFAEMLRGMSARLQHCAGKDLVELMELPAVKLGRAKQLLAAGYGSLQMVARADPAQLMSDVDHLSRRIATQLVAAAKLLLLEKVENLREEAEDVLEGIRSD